MGSRCSLVGGNGRAGWGGTLLPYPSDPGSALLPDQLRAALLWGQGSVFSFLSFMWFP